MKFAEGDLEMDIPDVVGGGKFDGGSHGLNRCNRVGAGPRDTDTTP